MAITNILVGNNIIYTQKIGSTEAKDSRETILFGAERVDVGVNSGNKEIANDSISGLNYERDKIDSKTIYNLKTQKRKCFFVLDLETGSRGWYPGCIQIADIKDNNVEIKSDKSDDSQTITVISNITVKVLDLEYDQSKNIWYKINYNDQVGYVKNIYISNVRYSDPY